MPTQRTIQTNFTTGQLGENMRARVDLPQYQAGADELTNVVVMATGGAAARSGSAYIGAAKSQVQRARLVPFIVSSNVAYVLEFGAAYVRFWRNRAPVLSGGVPLELATPYVLADLRQLRFAQSIDVMYVFHSGYQTRSLSRNAAAVFSLAVAVFVNGPYDVENTGDVGAALPIPATGADAGATPPPTTGSGTGSGGSATAPPSPPPEGGAPGEGGGGESADAGGGAGPG